MHLKSRRQELLDPEQWQYHHVPAMKGQRMHDASILISWSLWESCTSTDIAWLGPRMVGQSAHALKKR